MSRCVWLGALVASLATSASAQFGGLIDRARSKAEEAAGRKVDQAVDEATRKKPDAKPASAEQKPPPAEQSPAAAGQAPPGAATSDTAKAPEVYGNRFDFVPGEKVLVMDEFADTDVGDYPAKWTVKDRGGGNAVEVVEIAGKRFLKSRLQQEHQTASLHWLRFDPKGDLPRSFTIELDADLAGPFAIVFSDVVNYGGREIRFGWTGREVWAAHAEGRLPVKEGVQHVSIAVSGTQVKVYVAGERVLADPEGVERPIKRIGVQFMQPNEGRNDHQMFTAFRLAEGGKDAKRMLAEGRIVTHGIQFDTGSDVLRPESGPALRSVLALLQEDPGLRFAIEGHTDDQGGPQVNGPLSQRRAEAVKGWLVRQGVDASRLTASGLGATRPVDTNATAEGRANNRRVEFVKLAERADAR